MAWLRLAILFCCAALVPSLAEAKPLRPGVRRPFVAGAIVGGAALGVHMGAAFLSLRNEAWRPCFVHCDNPLARPANLAVPLAATSAALLATAAARGAYADGYESGARRGDRGVIAIGIVTLALGLSGVITVARIAETKCTKTCPGIVLSEIPLGAIAVTGVTAIAFGIGKRAGARARARMLPTISIGRTPTIGISGRF